MTIEALASGTPVVNADIPINREILQKEEGKRKREEGNTKDSLVQGGLLFKAGDAADLAEKIELLLTDRKLYNQKVGEGRELAKRYEWERVNNQTEEFYQRLLSD
ncbi:MAG: Glycosyl transferase group 1 [Candidatus Magasanikbacteria bacterium GW2011_GWA2_45_39]|uniref:Glycosyl transferase group 1 n=1 Tax=Candidatus Magasanikbacteria bacterium GW2011_GWA2_45_39 TaxID=1619041 RepID=A0A0G1MCU9_9BACT|nr:MAG: Glycosyl transferase group 1 [Candidatus Magasanikbacteria bacterium GW2011_GWA2_45_39]